MSRRHFAALSMKNRSKVLHTDRTNERICLDLAACACGCFGSNDAAPYRLLKSEIREVVFWVSRTKAGGTKPWVFAVRTKPVWYSLSRTELAGICTGS